MKSKDRIKHIYWFAYFDLREPSVRYRGKYALKWLKENKSITYSFVYPSYKPKNILIFLFTYFEALFFRKRHSVIVFENIYTNRIYANLLKVLLRIRKYATVYDIDDADYLRFPAESIHYFMKNCSSCSVGSKTLFDYCEQYNENILLLTSPVITHGIKKHSRNNVFTLGWIGYYKAHQESLKQLLIPALVKVNFPLKVVLLGVVKPEHRKFLQETLLSNPNLTLEMPDQINWLDENSVYSMIAAFDCGVSPLLDTEMNRAKSAFKLKQYLSCGVPSLCTSVGENNRFIEHDRNGFVCNTSGEFSLRIKQLRSLDDKNYFMMSANAHETIHHFSMKHYGETLLNYFNLQYSAYS